MLVKRGTCCFCVIGDLNLQHQHSLAAARGDAGMGEPGGFLRVCYNCPEILGEIGGWGAGGLDIFHLRFIDQGKHSHTIGGPHMKGAGKRLNVC